MSGISKLMNMGLLSMLSSGDSGDAARPNNVLDAAAGAMGATVEDRAARPPKLPTGGLLDWVPRPPSPKKKSTLDDDLGIGF